MNDILNLLKDKEYLENIKYNDEYNLYSLVFKLRNGYKIPLRMKFSERFPVELPQVIINNDEYKVPNKPHVFQNGGICYLENEGVVWSDKKPLTLDFVFHRIENVLFEKDNLIEFHKEFNYYFSTLKNVECSISICDTKEHIEEIMVLKKNKKPAAFLGNGDLDKALIKKMFGNLKKFYYQNALYIPLNKVYHGKIPRGDDFWSSKEINSIIKEHYVGDINEVLNYTKNKNDFYYLIKMKLLTGNSVLFGLWYKKKAKYSKKCQPLIEEDAAENFEIRGIQVFRFDSENIFARDGGGFNDKKVLLIGCGAVGSDLAILISRSGVKNLDIVDPDILIVENTYRHFLGFNETITNSKKVNLMKLELEKRYPMMNVAAYDNDILSLLEEKTIRFENYDLIISAIGDPNIERVLSRRVLNTSTPAIFSWVEAYGIGGHSLIINNGKRGCYNCMFDEELKNKVAFAKSEDKPFIKSYNGCSGTFTPYGSIDAMETALLASRIALKILNDQKLNHTLLSWRGDSELFLSEGHELTERYFSLGFAHQGYKDDIFEKGCPICSESDIL